MIKNISIKLFLIFFSLIFCLSFFSVKAYAACDGKDSCSRLYPGFSISIDPNPYNRDIHDDLNITAKGLAAGSNYTMYVDCTSFTNDESNTITSTDADTPYTFTWHEPGWCFDHAFTGQATKEVCLRRDGNLSCFVGTYMVISQDVSGCSHVFSPPYPGVNDLPSVTLTISDLIPNEAYWLSINGPNIFDCDKGFHADSNGVIVVDALNTNEVMQRCITTEGVFNFVLEACAIQGPLCKNVCEFSLTVFAANENPEEPPEGSIKLLTPTPCTYNGAAGIQTALGCFPTEPKAIAEWFIEKGIMFGGGIAFLLMLFGAFQLLTSSGDPEKLKKGQEILFSALAGLLLIIFAVFILRFIGVTILQLPDWG